MDSMDHVMIRLRKAVAIVARRLRNEDGNYDIEACWALGVLSTVGEVDLEELEQAGYSRITFLSCGDKKIHAIKIVRDYLGCGLKEGKDLVEGTTTMNASALTAKAIKEECEQECGSNICIRPWKEQLAGSPSIGRGLDLDDEPSFTPINNDLPF